MLFIFDMGGVVTKNFLCAPKISSALGISEEQFKNYCDDGLFDTLCTGKITIQQFWASFTVKSGLSVPTDYWQLFFNPTINEETKSLILELRKKNRVVCGTNTMTSHYEIHSQRGDYSIFDKVYASQNLKVQKPDPEFFRLILLAEGVKPQDAIFFDDFPENVEGAASCGINAFLFTDALKARSIVRKYLL